VNLTDWWLREPGRWSKCAARGRAATTLEGQLSASLARPRPSTQFEVTRSERLWVMNVRGHPTLYLCGPESSDLTKVAIFKPTSKDFQVETLPTLSWSQIAQTRLMVPFQERWQHPRRTPPSLSFGPGSLPSRTHRHVLILIQPQRKRWASEPLTYTVPNAQKINTIARTQYRASHIPPPPSRGYLNFPGGGFLPCPEVGWGKEDNSVDFYTI